MNPTIIMEHIKKAGAIKDMLGNPFISFGYQNVIDKCFSHSLAKFKNDFEFSSKISKIVNF